jgi:hypothetical protein
MSEKTVWFYPDGNPNAFGKEIPFTQLPSGAQPLAEHITEDGRTLTAYIASS